MYPIICVPDDAAFLTEQLGTKRKFWFRKDGQNYLFKEPRPNTGEDWAEKVASELCSLLNLPHASYELGIWKDRRGVVSPTFVSSPQRLVHGNELLAQAVQNYPKQRFYRVREHVLKHVLAIIKALKPDFPPNWQPINGITTSADVFLGYIMLDAWIANQDRHHENWSIIVLPKTTPTLSVGLYLAPSYDHASSLGRNENDAARKERLTTKDMGRHISTYVEKATSAFYDISGKQLTTIEAFCEAGKTQKEAAKIWLEQLKNIKTEAIRAIWDQIPKTLITDTAIEFADTMLKINRERLLATMSLFL